jgi:hypothetical protein
VERARTAPDALAQWPSKPWGASAATNRVERKQIAFTLALISLRDRSPLPASVQRQRRGLRRLGDVEPLLQAGDHPSLGIREGGPRNVLVGVRQDRGADHRLRHRRQLLERAARRADHLHRLLHRRRPAGRRRDLRRNGRNAPGARIRALALAERGGRDLRELSIKQIDVATPLALFDWTWGGFVSAISDLLSVYDYDISDILSHNGNDNMSTSAWPTPGETGAAARLRGRGERDQQQRKHHPPLRSEPRDQGQQLYTGWSSFYRSF